MHRVRGRGAALLALVAVSFLLGLIGCGGEVQRLSIEDSRGDAAPGYLDIVEGSIELAAEQITVVVVVSEDFPNMIDGAASWTTTIFAPGEPKSIIAVHLEGREWLAELGRGSRLHEPTVQAKRIDFDAPSKRRLVVTVPIALVDLGDFSRATVEVTSSGDEGVVDSARSRVA